MWHISRLWPTTIDRQSSNTTYSSFVAHQHMALLTLPDHSMPRIAMEANAAYQGCRPSCELHSRSLTVRRTGTCDLKIAHTRFMQSRDCANCQIAWNIYRMMYDYVQVCFNSLVWHLLIARPNYVVHVFSIKPCVLTLFVEDCNNIKYWVFWAPAAFTCRILLECYISSLTVVVYNHWTGLVDWFKNHFYAH